MTKNGQKTKNDLKSIFFRPFCSLSRIILDHLHCLSSYDMVMEQYGQYCPNTIQIWRKCHKILQKLLLFVFYRLAYCSKIILHHPTLF